MATLVTDLSRIQFISRPYRLLSLTSEQGSTPQLKLRESCCSGLGRKSTSRRDVWQITDGKYWTQLISMYFGTKPAVQVKCLHYNWRINATNVTHLTQFNTSEKQIITALSKSASSVTNKLVLGYFWERQSTLPQRKNHCLWCNIWVNVIYLVFTDIPARLDADVFNNTLQNVNFLFPIYIFKKYWCTD